MLGSAVETVPLPGRRVDIEGELGGDDDLIADRGQRLADELLVDERAVCLRGVEERHAPLDRLADERDHLAAVRGLAVVDAHAHAPQSESGHLQGAERARGKTHVDLL